MCLRDVYSKEEFERRFGKLPKCGYKIFIKKSNGRLTGRFINTYKIIPTNQWLSEYDYRYAKTITLEYSSSGYEYRIGWHIYICNPEMLDTNNRDLFEIKKVKFKNVLAYGTDKIHGNDVPCIVTEEILVL